MSSEEQTLQKLEEEKRALKESIIQNRLSLSRILEAPRHPEKMVLASQPPTTIREFRLHTEERQKDFELAKSIFEQK